MTSDAERATAEFLKVASEADIERVITACVHELRRRLRQADVPSPRPVARNPRPTYRVTDPPTLNLRGLSHHDERVIPLADLAVHHASDGFVRDYGDGPDYGRLNDTRDGVLGPERVGG